MKNEKIKFKALVDRIEGKTAVVLLGEEEKESFHIPIDFLPSGIKEGDILTFKIASAKDRTKEAKEKVRRMIEKLTS